MMRACRRRFIGAIGGGLGAILLAACSASPPASPTSAPAPASAPVASAPSSVSTAPAATAQPAAPQATAAPASSGVTEVTIWDNANDPKTSIKYLDAAYAAYTKAQNKVTAKGVHGQSTDKILAALTAGQPPDIIYMWDGQEPLGSWAQKGLIVPIDDQVKARNFDLTQIHPAALATCKFRGNLYGLPVLADGMFYFANVAKLKEAALDSTKPPATWTEWLDWTLKLTKKDST